MNRDTATVPQGSQVLEETSHVQAPPRGLLVRVAGNSTIFVRRQDGSYIPSDGTMVYGELDHQWGGGVETYANNKRMDVADLYRAYGARADEIIFDLVAERSGFEPDDDGGGTLFLPCARRIRVAPKEDPEIAAWLLLWAGARHEKVLDWLATMGDLSRPTAAVYVKGRKGSGKGLFHNCVASLWGPSVTTMQNVTRNQFNSSLRKNPIVWLDEGADVDHHAFRSMVANRQHQLEDKHKPAGTLRGCVRPIITANDWCALPLGEGDTFEDDEAIGQRILAVDVPEAAAEYLRDTPSHTEWITSGRFAGHVAWLEETRGPKVKRGTRFMVEGDLPWSELREAVEADEVARLREEATNDPDWPKVERAHRESEGTAIRAEDLLNAIKGAANVKGWPEGIRRREFERIAGLLMACGRKRRKARTPGHDRPKWAFV